VKNPAKELYNELRRLAWPQLWDTEAARFDRADPQEREKTVAVVRAVGVVFSESGPAEERENVKRWLTALLHDPSEKIRRYAMTALPKIGAGAGEETQLLDLLRATPSEREKKFLGRTLDKIGGTATLEVLGTSQKVRASVARAQSPSTIAMDRALPEFAGVRIHLRGRKGLENIVREEVEAAIAREGKFRLVEVAPGRVALDAVAPFCLGDLYALRCFGSVGFVLGSGHDLDALASVMASSLSRRILKTFTEGAIRYRLNFVSKGHQRGAVRTLAERVFAAAPEILNDARNAPWSMNLYDTGRGTVAELSPRLVPDPRFYYRQDDVPAASHPPLAACMARLAGKAAHEVVWDPFCGSGLELIERALLGGVKALYGTDLSGEAIAVSQNNLAAANVAPLRSKFVISDFRDFAAIEGLGPNTVSLILTNPPMGRRVPIADLNGLIADLIAVAATVLVPGGRLVFANPLPQSFVHPALKLISRQEVDFGAFFTRLERYVKLPTS
jgi:23S rRNA G2445 N2-methylase RlmL